MNEYDTSVDRLECNCLDWVKSRMNYEKEDPRRLCKHIIRKLDVDNLPLEIKNFKDMICFYQKKSKGFKTNFQEIVNLENLTLLGLFDWIDVCDDNGIRYGVKKEDNYIRWAKDIKPSNYKIVESYLIENIHFPKPLSIDEKTYAVQKLKQLDKRCVNLEISIEESRFSPSETKRPYEIYSSDYYIDATEIYVNNDYTVITMYTGEEYQIKRDDSKLKKIKIKREIEEKKQREQESLLIKQRKEFDSLYNNVTNLLKAEQSPFGSVKFNNYLKKLDLVYKDESINGKRWIIQGFGLHYGVNHTPNYSGKSFPFWRIDRFSNLHAFVLEFSLDENKEECKIKIRNKIKLNIEKFESLKADNSKESFFKKIVSWLGK